MVDYIGKTITADMEFSDGCVQFEKDQLVWVARQPNEHFKRLIIEYKNIRYVKVNDSKRKLKATIVLRSGREVDFYLYEANKFIELVEAGKEEYRLSNKTSTNVMSDEDLDRLTKLSQLHKDGILDDEQFKNQKEAIMARYQ